MGQIRNNFASYNEDETTVFMKGEGTMKKAIFGFIALVVVFTIILETYGERNISYKRYVKYEMFNPHRVQEKILVKTPSDDEWMVAAWKITWEDGETTEDNWK